MDDVLDDLEKAARRCERAAAKFESEPLVSMFRRLLEACNEIGRASTNSWWGYQATVYLEGFREPAGWEHFSIEWGEKGVNYGDTRGPWVYYTFEDVKSEVMRRAGVSDFASLDDAAEKAEEIFNEEKSNLLPILDALLSTHDDNAIRDARDKIGKLQSHFGHKTCIDAIRPKGQTLIRDMRAAEGGHRPPLHLQLQTWLMSQASHADQLKRLASTVRHAKRYMEARHKMKGKSIAKTEGRITIGHGRSEEWRVLKEFLKERIGIEVDEFNQTSPAGMPNTERLSEMLDVSCFAFLVMTAENLDAEGRRHARENVIHEIGLFQGRLGFRRAIVLLEEGCEEFSNIQGIGQIRFEGGRMPEKFEEIRNVLEREKII